MCLSLILPQRLRHLEAGECVCVFVYFSFDTLFWKRGSFFVCLFVYTVFFTFSIHLCSKLARFSFLHPLLSHHHNILRHLWIHQACRLSTHCVTTSQNNRKPLWKTKGKTKTLKCWKFFHGNISWEAVIAWNRKTEIKLDL